MSNEAWAAIIGGAVGAILAGAISAALQWAAQWHVARERNRGLAYALLFKVALIYSHLRVLNDNYGEAFEGNDPRAVENPWTRLEPLANSPSHITFAADEMALVVAFASSESLNSLMVMDELHNATFDAFAFYAKKWNELIDLAKPVAVGGGAVTIEYGDDLPVQMRIMAINQFTVKLGEHLAGDAGKALNVLQQLSEAFTDNLGVKFTALPKQP